MEITLQPDQTVNVFQHDGYWKCKIGEISYMAPTREQLLSQIRDVHPITDHTLTEQLHHNFVFHPHKYPLK